MADESIPAAERHYHFAKILTARRLTLYKHLIEAKEIIVEIESENSAIHKAINLLAANLKEEERNKLQIKYAEYTPKTPPKKILTRRSAEENVIESIAKTMFAPRNEANIIQWEALEAHERLSLVTKARDYYKNMFNKKDAK
jgi:hemerythrin superfamily protein